jgi:hypothetical protein
MEILSKIISGVSISDARSVLYYLSRYLKQASHYDEYKKDIFEDDSRSYPSEQVRSLTWAAIAVIEEAEGCQIADFEDPTYIKWSEQVDSLESSLDPAPSLNEVAKASEFSESLILPKANTTD